jgi:DNA-binding MarR family transcriptional regulator
MSDPQEKRPHEKRPHDDLRLWLRLFQVSNLIEGQLRTRLLAAFDTSLARFDFLAQLDRETGGLAMSDVSRRLMVTNAAVTGLADALEGERLIERVDDPNDRRRSILRLTARGKRDFADMAKQHEGWVTSLFAGLDAGDKARLYELLTAMRDGVRDAIGRQG